MVMEVRGIEIRQVSDNWSGVAARRDFAKGEVIEQCPMRVLNIGDANLVARTGLENCCARYRDDFLILLGGYGAAYLPSENPNATFELDLDNRAFVVQADRKIKHGEFIYVNKNTVQPAEVVEEYSLPALWNSRGLVVRPVFGKGLGVFTTQRFYEGDIVELCPLFSLSERETSLLDGTLVERYAYSHGYRNQLFGWAIGYPCFYNCSEEPTVDPWHRIETLADAHMAVLAVKDLEPGTELTFDYVPGGRKEDLGFEFVK